MIICQNIIETVKEVRAERGKGTCLAIAKSTAQYPTLGNFRSC